MVAFGQGMLAIGTSGLGYRMLTFVSITASRRARLADRGDVFAGAAANDKFLLVTGPA